VFGGQRAPFVPGHEVSVSHGATSDRHVLPLAARLREDLLAGDGCPVWLHEPVFDASLRAWSEAEARVLLLREWADRMPFDEALSELTVASEDESRPAMGSARRSSRSRRRMPAVEMLRAWMTKAQSLRNDLGLTPKSYAAMARDVALVGRAQGEALERAGELGRAIRERREAERCVAGSVEGEPVS
jgi:hypothetical protein